jgi:hypothetical protein
MPGENPYISALARRRGALLLATGRESYQLQKAARVTVKSQSTMGLLFIYCVMAMCSLGLIGAIGATVYYLLTRWPHHQ